MLLLRRFVQDDFCCRLAVSGFVGRCASEALRFAKGVLLVAPVKANFPLDAFVAALCSG
jgi:hypothetical protein